MERVWAELKSQERLLQLSQPEVAGLVTRAVDEAMASLESRRGELPARYAALEKARLQRLLLNWLELEKQRDPFVVLEPERERYIEIGGVRCMVKPDRVDRLPGGEHVMIDYKTGEPGVSAWFGDRPDEPQLPVYSATYGGRIGGVLFAQLKPGKLAFKGITSAHVQVAGAKQDHLEDQIDGWRQVLERLGADFRAGVAVVDPKKPAQSCRNCELAPLCRVSEADIAYQEDGCEGRP
jgi:RecB family exonuclease